MTACTAKNGVQARDAFVCTSPMEKLLPCLPLKMLLGVFCYHFLLFYLEPSAGCCRQQMIATFPPESHLISPPTNRMGGAGRGGILQAVNELPSVPRVKGTCKLTAAFVRALIGFFQSSPPPPSRSLPLLHFLPLPACFTLRRLRGRSSAVWLGSGAHCRHGSCSELAV